MTPDPLHLTIVLFLAALISLLVLIFRPAMTRERGGRMLAFLLILVFPILALQVGANVHLEHSKSTEFCLGCHEMEVYNKSLHVDDEEFLAAVHYQNARVPQEKACFTCHTDYTMYGDVTAKLRGLRHVLVHYTGQTPEEIELYQPYNNRECLHCHGEARSFLEESAHTEEDTTMTSLLANRMSCLESGCHDVAHGVDELEDYEMWSPRQMQAAEAQAAPGGEEGDAEPADGTETEDGAAAEDSDGDEE